LNYNININNILKLCVRIIFEKLLFIEFIVSSTQNIMKSYINVYAYT